LHALVPLLAAAGLLLGIALIGRFLRDKLRDQDRYSLPFAEIDCEPPPGMGRAEFLEEVQFRGNQPERLRLLDEDLTERLAAAFALHGWVEKVGVVKVMPRGIHVELVYRTPVLAVRYGGKLRAVDGLGVLLPKSANTNGLPIYSGNPPAPINGEGHPWGDAGVEAAARNARKNQT
jgi:hypothetical protein